MPRSAFFLPPYSVFFKNLTSKQSPSDRMEQFLMLLATFAQHASSSPLWISSLPLSNSHGNTLVCIPQAVHPVMLLFSSLLPSSLLPPPSHHFLMPYPFILHACTNRTQPYHYLPKI
ncbi:hypothetical protein GALMADRAFT_709033 [Galerina marginata CBS 339.88]|uniref:Uncharacterized protein n=1 Tax=Galerina marginata (strain CBS 339.88) TaxID=685588 RepID=A0A067TZ55_GALM3|nr:hypothetical protein GALMADRAFT_709033 [Galerina marginata CBS 339.88]